jgi:cyclase
LNCKKRVTILCVLLLGPWAAFGAAAGQNPTDEAEIQILPVQGNVYMLVGAGANIAVSVGRDGVLVVDTGSPDMSEQLLETIQELAEAITAPTIPVTPCVGVRCAEFRSPYGLSSPRINATISSPAPPKPIRYIINTTIGAEHTGGNEALALGGQTFLGGNVASNLEEVVPSTILAHENVLNRMLDQTEGPDALSFDALPSETYYLPTYKLSQFFNGEGIQLYHQANAITDGDSVVFFRYSDVILTGDIFSTTSYPMFDLEQGGSIQGVLDGLNFILGLAFPEFRSQGGTMIIPGHGRLSDTGDVAIYRNMVTVITDRIRRMIGQGMSLDEVIAARPSLDYDPRYDSDTNWTGEMFVEAVYRSLDQ